MSQALTSAHSKDGRSESGITKPVVEKTLLGMVMIMSCAQWVWHLKLNFETKP